MYVTNIMWDTDGISIDDLPEEVQISDSEKIGEDGVADYLSDVYGWCVKSFCIEGRTIANSDITVAYNEAGDVKLFDVATQMDDLVDAISNSIIGASNDGCSHLFITAMRDNAKHIPYNAVNLCDSCKFTYPECYACFEDVCFGDGKGNDNICACAKYVPSCGNQYLRIECPENAVGSRLKIEKMPNVD